jgi:uncharacterized protein (TIGR01777 family)
LTHYYKFYILTKFYNGGKMSKRIIVTGGTGFIGKKLCCELVESAYDVIVLTRNIVKAKNIFGDKVDPILWDSKTSEGWIKFADGAHAIINLAGDNIGAGRWTKKKKQRILQSRIHAGKAVVEAITQAKNKSKVVLQASGIGIYGDRSDGLLDEASSLGSGFIPDLARQWELSVKEIETTGVRVVYIRTGVVLGEGADFLKRTLLPFRFFIGGHLGSGKQWISWIHLEDEVRAIKFLLEREDLNGVFNLSAPNPLTFKEFFKTLGKVMNRPSWFHVPGSLLKILLGEMAEGLILSGQRAIPKRLLAAGFKFTYPELESALKEIIK